jgi:hypothetical protein
MPTTADIGWIQTSGLWGEVIQYPLPMQPNQADASNQRRGQPPGDKIDQRWQKQQLELFIDPNIATIQGPSYYARALQTQRMQNYGYQGQYVGAGITPLDTYGQAPTLQDDGIVAAFKKALSRRLASAGIGR